MGILALDDTDSSIAYSVGWNKAGSGFEYNNTTTWTVVAGSTAKIAFHGTSIGVYGTITAKSRKSVPPTSAYSIDDGPLTGFKAVQDPKTQYSQLFYQSPTLPDGAHVLTITNTVVADPLFLDFLLVNQAADTPTGGPAGLPLPTGLNSTASVSSSGSASSSSASSASSSSSVVTTSAATTPTAAPLTVTITSIASSTTNSADAANASAGSADLGKVGSSRKSNAGAVVGGVLGAMCVLLLLAFGFVYWNRRRQRRNSMMSYRAAGSGSYWNRPLEAAATPHSDLHATDPYTLDPSPPPPPPPLLPNMAQNQSQRQNYPPSVVSGTNGSGYGNGIGIGNGNGNSVGYGNGGGGGGTSGNTSGYGSGNGNSNGQTQTQSQTRYPGGYTPGADYYESSDLAYAVNPPGVGVGAGGGGGGGYLPPSQLMNAAAAPGYSEYSEYNAGYPNAGNGGYGGGYGAGYTSQGGYGSQGYGRSRGYAPPPQLQPQPQPQSEEKRKRGERVRVRLD